MGSTAFQLSLLAHLACVIVGYGAVAVDSLTEARPRRLEAEEAYAVAQAGYTSTVKRASRFLYGVPVFGALAVATSQGRIAFSQAWVSAAFVVWIAGIGVLHGLVAPARRRSLLLGELAGARAVASTPSPTVTAQKAQLAGEARRVALGQALFNLATAVALVLMVWQPGG